jgi:Zn-dependent protease with chaperone function
MNPLPNLNFWLQTLGLLAVQTAVIVGLAAAVQIWLKSAAARRAAWQGALLGVALLTVNAFTGADRALASWAKLEPAARRIAVARGNLPSTLDTSHAGVLPVSRPLPVAGSEVSVQPTAPLWWPAWLWLAGTLVFGGRALGSRLLLAALVSRADTALLPGRRRGNESSVLAEKQSPSMSPERRTPVRRVGIELEQRVRAELEFGAPTTRPRRPVKGRGILLTSAPTSDGPAGTVVDPELQARVASLAKRLGLRRPVRLMESAALVGPIAFGWWRPTIGLPQDFFARHSQAEQDTMLAHELAHLAARDPLWLALADALSAALWWHPAVWWLRRQFRVASETAADDASLLVQDGPVILADCLVSLAAQLQTRRATGWLGMAEFRSGLGRRVERLLKLQPEEGGALGQKARWVAPALVALVFLGLAVTAWAFPQSRSEGPTLFALMQEAIGPEPLQESDLPRWYIVQLPGTTVYNSLTGFSVSAPAEEVAAEAPPGTTPSSATSSTTVQSNVLAAQVAQDAKLYYELGKLDEAEARLKLAIRIDSDNQTAPYSAGLVQAAREARAAMARTNSEAGGQLFTRTYRVDMPSLLEGMPDPFGTNQWTVQDQSRALEAFFRTAGWERMTNESFYLNDRKGLLLVRATLANLDRVEQALQVATAIAPQVLVQVKFVEVSQSTGKALGFDWFLGNTSVGPTGTAMQVTSGLRSSNPAGVFPGGGPVVAAPRELRGDELDWTGRDATNAQNIRVSAALGADLTGILTEPQFRVVLRALEQRQGVEVLSTPSVTTMSGRQAQIRVQDLMAVVTGTQAGGGTNVPTTATVACGPVLDVVPTVLADGVTIQLKLKASVTEFLGYDPTPPGAATVPQPRFRERQLQTTANVWEGQTLVLGGPVVGAAGTGTNSAAGASKKLLLFVTPTLIDPAGNRLHSEEGMPSSTNALPPPPKPVK